MSRLSILREWNAGQPDAPDYDLLPPDLTPAGDCPATGRVRGWPVFCTRPADHTCRHAAGDGKRIVAVWGDRP